MRGQAEQQKISQLRIVIAFGIFGAVLLLLFLRLGYVQIVKGEEYSKRVLNIQKKDQVLKPNRGKILDRNGEELAVNVDSYTVWASKDGMDKIRGTKTRKEKAEDKKKTKEELYDDNVNTLAKLIDKKPDEIKKTLNENKRKIVKIAQNLKKEKGEEIKKMGIPGISVENEARRYYPMGDFLSHTLGSTREDNSGLSGVELEYNNYLSGVQGRWLKNTDAKGNPLASGEEKYYRPEDGNDVTLTIDQVIQTYTEQSVREAKEKNKAKRASCIIMDTKTGEILSMASYPSFDPNNSKEPLDSEEKKKFNKMSNGEKIKYLNEMWRNPLLSNVYEPGSTAKLVTAAACLEEGITNKDDTFKCVGYHTVSGIKVKCWSFDKPHGKQNLYQGVGNSCNPVFMQLALRLGKEKFYRYLDLFGLTEKTGIDFPGEANPILLKEKNARPLDLAIMGFGQTNAVTPVQLVTAISAMGNDGKLMQPHILKKVTDKSGNVIRETKPVVVRQAISKETAAEMRTIMQYVVDNSTGKKAKIAGYKVGGKTGTSQVPAEKGGYTDDVIASFVGMVPMENPRFTILYIIDSPAAGAHGGEIAAPASSELLEKVLKYKDIKPNYTEEEKKNKDDETVEVPDVKGLKLSNAKKKIDKAGLKYKIIPALDKEKDFIIREQYPSAGGRVNKNGVIYLYRE